MRWRISKKASVLGAILLLAMSFSVKYMPLAFWDFLFLSGLVLFMLGGGALLLEKGIFNHFFASFQTLLRSTSKVEAYAAEKEQRQSARRISERKSPVTKILLGSGIIIIASATVFPLYLF
ncbi:DUF3899 domain-containing protein [Planococcus sp. 1R117A]|uniref:DUF3899 domain-containing protein n=1 Tax=Planococcus sp. 1R117A TaxID=3447020 RepID=UPI003EDBC449